MARLIVIGNSGLYRIIPHLVSTGHAVDTIVVARNRLNQRDMSGLFEVVARNCIRFCIGAATDLNSLIKGTRADVLICAGWPDRVPGKVLECVAHAINIHPSILPMYRGHFGHWRMILEGASECGLSVHVMTEEMDAGPVLLIERWPIKAHDTTASLLKRFQSRAGCAIVEALDRLLSGCQPVPQSGESSWVPRLSGDEPFELDLDRSLRWNLTRIRAGSFPGHAAFVDLEGGRLNIAAWPDEAKEGGQMK